LESSAQREKKVSDCFFCEKPEPCGCPLSSYEASPPPPEPFPAPYYAPGTWGWSVKNADELFNYFKDFNACHLRNPYNDLPLETLSVSYVADVNNSQCFGGYHDPNKPKSKDVEKEEEHCAGHKLPSSEAPDCIRKLQVVLNGVLHNMPGYEKRQINYISVMHYPNENAGINWHKHGEDNGCNTPVLLASTGEVRDLYLGKQVRGRKMSEGPDVFWKQPMEHGSLIVLPDAMNYTHWHAILKNTPANRKKYGVPDISYGSRISINTKCMLSPTVFSLKGRHPRWAVYVGCAGEMRTCPCHKGKDGTLYGNGVNPFEGHYPVVSNTEAGFRAYAEERMQDATFRAQAIKDLRGRHLLCWCSQGQPFTGWCHARVWREIVNRQEYGK
jgi:hypothetical protein